jgi:hypothetical protein
MVFLVALAGIEVAGADSSSGSDSLYETIAEVDAAVFHAFNHCNDPEQLRRYKSYFAPDVEFYHDSGGVTWTREDMIDNVRRNVCGNFRRERIPGTLEVFSVKDFGAIARGEHHFCRFDADGCQSRGDFVVIWRRDNGQWRITRALSFAHRSVGQERSGE